MCWHKADDCAQPIWCGKQSQSHCQTIWLSLKEKKHEYCGKENSGLGACSDFGNVVQK